jgi:hypothetical protein
MMIRKPYIRYTILCMVFSLLLSDLLYSQQNLPSSDIDSIPSKNKIELRSEKVANTFTFNGNIFISEDIGLGKIRLLENYRGTSLRATSSNFRDDQMLLIDYEYDIADELFVIAKQNWLFSSDTRSLQINQLERLNGRAGIRYFPINEMFFEALGGMEQNTQIGHTSIGPILNFSAGAKDLNLSDYKISTKVSSEYLSLDYDRVNAEINWLADVGRIYDDDNALIGSLRYKLLNRDFLNKYSIKDLTDFSVENRIEKRISSLMKVDVSLGKDLFAEANIIFSKLDVKRQYNKQISNLTNSNVYRELSEIQLGFSSKISYVIDDMIHTAGISFDSRNEDNNISKKFDISDQDIMRLRLIENQRDNSSSRTEFSLEGSWNITKKDSLYYDHSVSLFEYDTPSNENYDDRDEFSSITSIGYSRRISRYFNAAINGEIQLRHLVFLKSQRSAMNNWNRIYRINTHFNYQNEYLLYNPSFEILANYTIYDFEDVSPSVQSFSYRQISYRDSLTVLLTDKFSLRSRIVLRYYERGVLYWDTFMEAPQNSGLEKFIKVLLIVKGGDSFRIGSGLRFYDFVQENIGQSMNTMGMGEFSQRSWGPEALIEARLYDTMTIQIEGWYELQYLNNSKRREIPNFFMNVRYDL